MYLIDTDILSYAVRGDPAVLSRFADAGPAPCLISCVSLYELTFGIERSPKQRTLWQAWQSIADLVVPLAVDEDVAQKAASLRAQLEARGQIIGPIDPLIAATALVHGLCLVTHNVRHFENIPDLRTEDWTG